MKEIISVPKGNLNINGALCLIREKLRKKISKEFKFLLLSANRLCYFIQFDFELPEIKVHRTKSTQGYPYNNEQSWQKRCFLEL